MRNKIKIMADHQNITDEELERFKNFDSLLNKHYRILNEKKPGTWKVIVPAIVLIGSVVFYWMINNESKPLENPSSPSDSETVLDKTKRENIRAERIESEMEKKEMTKPEKAYVGKTDTQHTRSVEQKTDSTQTKESEPTIPVVIQSNPVAVSPSKTETVYVQAEPVEGYEVLYAYFAKEIIYPQEAVKDSIQGVLTVTFLINKQGKPEKIKTSGSLGKAFDTEAVRLIENMPLWKPATLNGQPVISKLSIPLTFQLQKK